ncbi:MAG: aminodeoxychorismate synthase component I [Bacteroidetes bacterium]|nr:aminodeoxychorismate synthase component I [Bacteroidota bacterium]
MPNIKAKLFAWAAYSSPVAWLDSNEYPHHNNTYDAMLALNMSPEKQWVNDYNSLQQVVGNEWLFGFFNYEFSNAWEQIVPTNPAYISVPKLQFFNPEKIWLLQGDTLTALYSSDANADEDFAQVLETTPFTDSESTAIDLSPRISKSEYIKHATALQQHILRGDIYEVNYCMEWFAENAQVVPQQIFHALNTIAKTPFAAYMSMENLHLMCASPERFLSRKGTHLYSQPIKGTAARHADEVLDKANAQLLKNDPKERAENIMITDLVRNDLSRIANKGSVSVAEQCAVYPFSQVHQMISTVVASCSENTHSLDIIDACFPMGSMTGAPKQRAMELINAYEVSQRGLYSGAVGYFAPNGDFDFNVVIRSLIYDAQQQYLSTHVGSALTAAANVEQEYEECQLKVEAIKRVLANKVATQMSHGTKV